MNSSAAEEAASKPRHCALCLTELTTVHLCGGCRRRAYCSRDCQTRDWKPSGGGQRHKHWCTLACGEEDLDWEVVSVPGKGLGVRAKRRIPAMARIMVDAMRAADDPVLLDLEPRTSTNGKVAARVSRVNHSCSPNAMQYEEESLGVAMLVARREIEAGEEITVAYITHDGSAGRCKDLGEARKTLLRSWGIVCPEDCVCRDKGLQALVHEADRLDRSIFEKACTGDQRAALLDVQSLLKVQEQMGMTPFQCRRTLHDGFEIAIMKSETVPQAVQYIERAYNTLSAVLHPLSEELIKCKTCYEKPTEHQNFALLD